MSTEVKQITLRKWWFHIQKCIYAYLFSNLSDLILLFNIQLYHELLTMQVYSQNDPTKKSPLIQQSIKIVNFPHFALQRGRRTVFLCLIITVTCIFLWLVTTTSYLHTLNVNYWSYLEKKWQIFYILSIIHDCFYLFIQELWCFEK